MSCGHEIPHVFSCSNQQNRALTDSGDCDSVNDQKKLKGQSACKCMRLHTFNSQEDERRRFCKKYFLTQETIAKNEPFFRVLRAAWHRVTDPTPPRCRNVPVWQVNMRTHKTTKFLNGARVHCSNNLDDPPATPWHHHNSRARPIQSPQPSSTAKSCARRCV